VKLRKDIELLSVQHESSEASLRKRHQEAINELTDQIEQLSKHRNKCVDTRDVSLTADSSRDCQDEITAQLPLLLDESNKTFFC